MGATFVITLREAFEASLILGIVYTYLDKIGARDQYRHVTLGGVLGLLASVGLGVGISSGANLLGALQAQNALGPDAVVVTLFCDDNKKYLSTDLLRPEPVREGYLSPDVQLLGFRSVRRTCRTCWSADEDAGLP